MHLLILFFTSFTVKRLCSLFVGSAIQVYFWLIYWLVHVWLSYFNDVNLPRFFGSPCRHDVLVGWLIDNLWHVSVTAISSLMLLLQSTETNAIQSFSPSVTSSIYRNRGQREPREAERFCRDPPVRPRSFCRHEIGPILQFILLSVYKRK